MKWLTRLRYFAEVIKVNYWLIPVTMILFSIILARVALLFSSDTEVDLPAVRSLLDTVGMASISLAGVTFSITIVALTLASQQFGPRTLRNFLGDRANQYTLGTFVATYSFCLALSGMPDALGSDMPQAAILLTYALAFHCIIVFVLFIHHVANGIRGSSILHNLHAEAYGVISRLLPPSDARLEQQQCLPDDFAESAEAVHITKAGFLQAIDHQSLLKIAAKHDLVIEMTERTGQFVGLSRIIARVQGDLTDELKNEISRCVAIGGVRTPEQDPQYLPERIAELAVRALSPSMNDPFTAIECIHWLGNLLQHVKQSPQQVCAYTDNNTLRLWVPKMTYGQLYDATLSTIKRYAEDEKVIKALQGVDDLLKNAKKDTESNE